MKVTYKTEMYNPEYNKLSGVNGGLTMNTVDMFVPQMIRKEGTGEVVGYTQAGAVVVDDTSGEFVFCQLSQIKKVM